MKRQINRNQLSLFDDPEEPTQKEWHEVPQHIFLSWPPRQQYEYCYKRDLEAAKEFARDYDENDSTPGLGPKWFLQRASDYLSLSLQSAETPSQEP